MGQSVGRRRRRITENNCTLCTRQLDADGKCPACDSAAKLYKDFGQQGTKRPRIEKYQNCTLEIDHNRGVVIVQLAGRVKLRISRIPLEQLAGEHIDLTINHFSGDR